MAWRGRGRRPPGGFSRHDITLKDDDTSDVPQNFPPVSNMPARAPEMDQMDAETLRLLVRRVFLGAAILLSCCPLSSACIFLVRPRCWPAGLLEVCKPRWLAHAQQDGAINELGIYRPGCKAVAGSYGMRSHVVQSRYNKMRAAFHASPFHIDPEPEAVHEGSQPAVHTYMDMQQGAVKKQQKGKAALHQVRDCAMLVCTPCKL